MSVSVLYTGHEERTRSISQNIISFRPASHINSVPFQIPDRAQKMWIMSTALLLLLYVSWSMAQAFRVTTHLRLTDWKHVVGWPVHSSLCWMAGTGILSKMFLSWMKQVACSKSNPGSPCFWLLFLQGKWPTVVNSSQVILVETGLSV